MQDTKKAKKQLIQELVALRQWLAACEAFNRQHQQTADMFPESEAHFAGDIGSCIDITERRQMEEALRESEARYRALVEGSFQALSIVRNGRREFAVAPVSFQGKTALQVTLQDMSERKRAEEVLTHAQRELERRVVERAAALHEANARLRQEIAIRTQVVAAQPEVVIHDTGHAIAPGHLPHIFDLFYITRNFDGGTVDLASQVGHGTTVTWRLPGVPAAKGVPVHSVRQGSIKPSL